MHKPKIGDKVKIVTCQTGNRRHEGLDGYVTRIWSNGDFEVEHLDPLSHFSCTAIEVSFISLLMSDEKIKKQKDVYYILSTPYTKEELQQHVKAFRKSVKVVMNPKIGTVRYSKEERARIIFSK